MGVSAKSVMASIKEGAGIIFACRATTWPWREWCHWCVFNNHLGRGQMQQNSRFLPWTHWKTRVHTSVCVGVCKSDCNWDHDKRMRLTVWPNFHNWDIPNNYINNRFCMQQYHCNIRVNELFTWVHTHKCNTVCMCFHGFPFLCSFFWGEHNNKFRGGRNVSILHHPQHHRTKTGRSNATAAFTCLQLHIYSFLRVLHWQDIADEWMNVMQWIHG